MVLITVSQLIYDAAKAADANVVGVAVLANGAPAQPGWNVVTRADGVRVRVDTANGAPNAAAVAAVNNFDLSAPGVAAKTVTRTQADAKSLAVDPDADYRLLRALMLLMMDELNILRTRVRAMDAAVAGAATLAALKTAWAALNPMPDRTASQIKPALLARVDTPEAD